MEHHLQQGAKAFQKHRWMLQCKGCSIKHRLRYFDAVVSSTVCFVAEHRQLYRKHLEKYEVQFRKFVRRIVGPPPGQIRQRNGMIFCMSGICVWMTGPVPVKFRPGQKGAKLNTRILVLTLQTYLPNAGCGEHLRGNHFQYILPV